MKNSALVRMLHAAGRRSHECGACAGLAEKFAASLRECATCHEFHGQIRHAAIFSCFVNGQHIRMIQFRYRFNLGMKARSNIRRIEQVRKHHLQRHDATRFALHRSIHDAHAAVRDLFLYDEPGNELDAFFLFLGKCRDQTPRTSPTPLSFWEWRAALLTNLVMLEWWRFWSL